MGSRSGSCSILNQLRKLGKYEAYQPSYALASIDQARSLAVASTSLSSFLCFVTAIGGPRLRLNRFLLGFGNEACLVELVGGVRNTL